MMTQDQIQKTSRQNYYKLLSSTIILAVYAYACNNFSYITADPDLWGHIKFGEEIWRLGHLPVLDPYSYTSAGQAWINHEWLAELLFFFIFTYLGSTGLLAFKLLLGIAVIHLLNQITIWDKNRGFFYIIYIICFLLLIPVLAPAFMVRPHLLTILCMTLLVIIFQSFFDGNHKILRLSPILMMVWVNCHGGVVAGIGIYGVVALVECIKTITTSENKARTKTLILYFSLSCLALLINPYGYRLWIFLYEDLTVPRAITEWQAIPIFNSQFLSFKILALMFLATLFFPGRKDSWQIIVIPVAIIFSFKEQRHSPLSALIVAPYLYNELIKLNFKKFHVPVTAVTHVLIQTLLVLFIGFQIYGAFYKYKSNDFKILVEPNFYPVYAVRFMNNNGIKGNMVVPFDWGEYVIWKMPDAKVSIDGRFTTAYPRRVIRMNENLSWGRPGWRQLLDEYHTDIILAARNEKAYKVLEGDKDWIKIYEDPIAKLFISNTAKNTLLEKFYNKQLVDTDQAPSFAFP